MSDLVLKSTPFRYWCKKRICPRIWFHVPTASLNNTAWSSLSLRKHNIGSRIKKIKVLPILRLFRFFRTFDSTLQISLQRLESSTLCRFRSNWLIADTQVVNGCACMCSVVCKVNLCPIDIFASDPCCLCNTGTRACINDCKVFLFRKDLLSQMVQERTHSAQNLKSSIEDIGKSVKRETTCVIIFNLLSFSGCYRSNTASGVTALIWAGTSGSITKTKRPPA